MIDVYSLFCMYCSSILSHCLAEPELMSARIHPSTMDHPIVSGGQTIQVINV